MNIQKNFEQTKFDYPDYKELFILGTCLYWDPGVNLETALKLIPYGGLIGTDNS